MENKKSIVLLASVSSLFGVFVGVGITIWFRLPDRTVDVLSFTETGFGIGLAILAVAEGLRIFELQSRVEKLEKQVQDSLTNVNALGENLNIIATQTVLAQSVANAALEETMSPIERAAWKAQKDVQK